jgi:hypothetical protein
MTVNIDEVYVSWHRLKTAPFERDPKRLSGRCLIAAQVWWAEVCHSVLRAMKWPPRDAELNAAVSQPACELPLLELRRGRVEHLRRRVRD